MTQEQLQEGKVLAGQISNTERAIRSMNEYIMRSSDIQITGRNTSILISDPDVVSLIKHIASVHLQNKLNSLKAEFDKI